MTLQVGTQVFNLSLTKSKKAPSSRLQEFPRMMRWPLLRKLTKPFPRYPRVGHLFIELIPAFMPAKPPPQIHVWEMYRELSKLNSKKSAGPDGLPGKIIKEFACELSIPVADILNASLREGYVPQIFKDVTVVPIPKEMPATIVKLRPISLTALLAKVCEGFVSKWVLEDIEDSIDRNQYGSIRGSSTTHCLIELLDVFYKGTDISNSVGTL